PADRGRLGLRVRPAGSAKRVRLTDVFTRRLLTAALLSSSLLLTACTGDDDDSGEAAGRLDAAADSLAAAEYLDISIAAKELPAGTRGLLSAQGVGDQSPAFDGDVKIVAGGATVGAEV